MRGERERGVERRGERGEGKNREERERGGEERGGEERERRGIKRGGRRRERKEKRMEIGKREKRTKKGKREMRDKSTCKCRSLSVVNKVIVNLTTRITNDNYIHCKMTVDTSRFLFELLIGRSSSNSKALGTTNCTNGNIRWMELNTVCLFPAFHVLFPLQALFPLSSLYFFTSPFHHLFV